ncbi:MAG: response regulator transcription factor [Chloroflexota bacterium]
MSRILVVDDEPTLVATVKFNLESEGYDVVSATDGEEAIAAFRNSEPDLVILDLMLGEMHGFEICRAIRKESDIPILILTARTEEVDKVVGLELGADDYMTKPFSMKELLARVRARLRRRDEPPSREQVLVAGPIRVDLLRREATRKGQPLSLKPKEFDLLVCLMRNRGRLLTRGQLLEMVWHYDGFDQTRTVDVHVGRLRDKIEERPASPAWIITVRGSGYRFAG